MSFAAFDAFRTSNLDSCDLTGARPADDAVSRTKRVGLSISEAYPT
jgi:hypothetical protein